MIFVDDSLIKVSGTLLPGIVKSLEIKDDALIEEQDVEGSSKKPKQAEGYEDAKVTIEIIMLDSDGQTKEQKLDIIQNLFKKAGQEKPVVHEIVNQHTAARRVTKVIFKNLTTKIESKREQITATLEFWAYIPMKITASKSTGNEETATMTNESNLSADYQAYLSSNSRGVAPTRTEGSPATDEPPSVLAQAAVKSLPYND